MEDFKIELDKIKDYINKLEQKYSFWQDCDFLNYLLDKICDIDYVEISKEDMKNHHTLYVVSKEEDKYKLKRLKED
jgi:hypothetical protein